MPLHLLFHLHLTITLKMWTLNILSLSCWFLFVKNVKVLREKKKMLFVGRSRAIKEEALTAITKTPWLSQQLQPSHQRDL